MKILIDGLNEIYAENVRLVKTLMKRESPDEHPELTKWALQMLYFNGSEWIEICRIDNYPHDKQKGSHIHAYKKDEVKRIDITFQEAEKAIKEISSRILKEKFKESIKFE
ncbi:hypothetical protein HY638_04765 [Candidatus Woesearchaeota archaeon]|nr:hypothetical protein [Candidatus Woesearchaeota archaeon]